MLKAAAYPRRTTHRLRSNPPPALHERGFSATGSLPWQALDDDAIALSSRVHDDVEFQVSSGIGEVSVDVPGGDV